MMARFTRKDFLEALFLDYYKEHRGFILVKSLKRGDPKMSTRYFPNIDILSKEHYAEERDVYYGICPRERMKAEKEHIRYVVALWADLDIGRQGHEDKNVFFEGPQQAARAIRSFPRAPSIIVESGRGAHLYWLLKQVNEVDDPEKIEAIIKRINQHLNCDTDASLDTVLRLPETINTKVGDQPLPCDVKFINTNFRYTLRDFENLAQRIVAPAPQPRPQAAAPSADKGPVAQPSEKSGRQLAAAAAASAGTAITDSLIVDETIIDELIDDLSMTSASSPPRIAAELAPNEDLEPEVEMAKTVTSITGTPYVATSSVLDRLTSARTEVEICLLGSSNTIMGVLVWSSDGLVGVQSGDDLYTIPVSSIAFIKSKADQV
ncbi:MAG: hypothetical protein AB1664_11685 [Thermodesulfobacteriota bacterium]